MGRHKYQRLASRLDMSWRDDDQKIEYIAKSLFKEVYKLHSRDEMLRTAVKFCLL